MFATCSRAGNTLYVSGRLAKKDGRVWLGKLGRELNVEDGKNAARSAAIEILAVIKEAIQDPNPELVLLL